MEKVKERVFIDYYEMITKSWTYDRLTNEERERFKELIFRSCTQKSIKGTYAQRWETLNILYSAFLSGVGYTGGNWRE